MVSRGVSWSKMATATRPVRLMTSLVKFWWLQLMAITGGSLVIWNTVFTVHPVGRFPSITPRM